jgi:putative endonuclease
MNKSRYYVYIIGNEKPVLYIGVTSNIIKRIHEHKSKYVKGFSKTYNLNKLLYYEVFESSIEAITREKRIKNWHREWKINLIKSVNPTFRDLYEDLIK